MPRTLQNGSQTGQRHTLIAVQGMVIALCAFALASPSSCFAQAQDGNPNTALYPNIDHNSQLVASSGFRTTLSANISASALTIPVADASGFLTPGAIVIGDPGGSGVVRGRI